MTVARSRAPARAPEPLGHSTPAELAHDARTPIATVKLAGETLSRRPDLPDDARRLAASAVAAAAHLEELVHRLSGASAPPGWHKVELGTLCRGVVHWMRPLFGARAVLVSAPHPVIGRWDPHRLTQCVQNALQNSLEHGTGAVCVSAARTDGGATLAVSDGGARAPDAPRRRGRGLAIIEAGARAHGGSVAIELHRDGSRVSVTLPRSS